MTSPSETALAWAASVTGAPVRRAAGLREGTNPWLLDLGPGGPFASVVLRLGGSETTTTREQFRTEAAALEAAAEHGVPAPRLLAADPEGDLAGAPALLSTTVPGSSRVPARATHDRLRALGAAAGLLHTVPVAPRPDLPMRVRPIAHVDFAALRRDLPPSALFEEAEQAVERAPAPAEETVLVHGDLWQGNTMWEGDTVTGLIDWDTAGAGHFGVDLGSVRCDVAVFFGQWAADVVLEGWLASSQSSGVDPWSLAFFDVVAALSTQPDMAAWLPVFADQGREDLAATAITERRDTFLRDALNRLDGRL